MERFLRPLFNRFSWPTDFNWVWPQAGVKHASLSEVTRISQCKPSKLPSVNNDINRLGVFT